MLGFFLPKLLALYSRAISLGNVIVITACFHQSWTAEFVFHEDSSIATFKKCLGRKLRLFYALCRLVPRDMTVYKFVPSTAKLRGCWRLWNWSWQKPQLDLLWKHIDSIILPMYLGNVCPLILNALKYRNDIFQILNIGNKILEINTFDHNNTMLQSSDLSGILWDFLSVFRKKISIEVILFTSVLMNVLILLKTQLKSGLIILSTIKIIYQRKFRLYEWKCH